MRAERGAGPAAHSSPPRRRWAANDAFAAAHADIVGYVPRSLPGGGLDPVEFSAEAFGQKVAILDDSLREGAVADPARGLLLFYAGNTPDDIPVDGWTSLETLSNSPYALVGDTDRMVDTLLERRERWGLT
jgi:hypothetical protein